MTTASKAPRARKSPVQARSRQTVSDILDAAARVFAAHGYAGAATTRVAERAGVSVGSLYQYFPNKDALLVALSERHIERAHARVDSVLQQLERAPCPLRELVHALVDAMVDVHLDEPELHRVLFEECPKKAPVPELEQRSEQELLTRLVNILAEHPEVEVADVELAAILIGQAIESLCHDFVLHGATPTTDRKRFTTEVTTMMTAYLSAGA